MSPPLRSVGNGNGNAPDYDSISDEELASLPLRQKIEAAVDRSLAVFTQIGQLTAASVRSERAAERCETYAKSMESSARTIDTNVRLLMAAQATAKTAAVPAPLAPMREKAPSIAEPNDADSTGVRTLKQEHLQLWSEHKMLLEAEQARQAVRASRMTTLKVVSIVIGILVGTTALAGTGYALVKFIATTSAASTHS